MSPGAVITAVGGRAAVGTETTTRRSAVCWRRKSSLCVAAVSLSASGTHSRSNDHPRGCTGCTASASTLAAARTRVPGPAPVVRGPEPKEQRASKTPRTSSSCWRRSQSHGHSHNLSANSPESTPVSELNDITTCSYYRHASRAPNELLNTWQAQQLDDHAAPSQRRRPAPPHRTGGSQPHATLGARAGPDRSAQHDGGLAAGRVGNPRRVSAGEEVVAAAHMQRRSSTQTGQASSRCTRQCALCPPACPSVVAHNSHILLPARPAVVVVGHGVRQPCARHATTATRRTLPRRPPPCAAPQTTPPQRAPQQCASILPHAIAVPVPV